VKNNKCSIDGCDNFIRAKGLCGKHYERVRTHGNPYVDLRSGKKAPFVKCKVEDCKSEAIHKSQMLCNLHWQRWNRHGNTDSKINYGSRVHIHEQGYIMIWQGDKYKMQHIILAEQALGKPLPKGAVVHHMNNNPKDNFTPFNLIVCPDQAYHLLLHKRMRDYELRQTINKLLNKQEN
jgi:hypothetical protein